MADNTEITWATHTFNPWWGCRQVSPACRFCYAKAWDKRYGGEHWGATTGRRTFGDKHWAAPLKWNRDATRTGGQVRVFCASMADVFEDHPALPEPRARLWRLIEDTPALTWILLTKRPENAAGMVPWGDRWPGNVWLGCSAETQRFADQRLPHLVASGAAVKFVSAAPLLGEVNLTPWLPVPTGEFCTDHFSWLCGTGQGACQRERLAWVITEGESGPKARPSHPVWFLSLRNQCEGTGVAFHHKQWGEFTPDMPKVPDPSSPDGWGWTDRPPTSWVSRQTGRVVKREADVPATGDWQGMWRVGKKAAGRLLDGVLYDAFPTAQAVAA